MKTKLFTSLILAFALVGLVWAGQATKNTPAGQEKAVQYVEKKVVQNDVELLIRVPKETPAGQPVELDVAFTNLGKNTVTIGQAAFYNDFQFSVSDDQGKPVRYTRFAEPFLGKKREDIWKSAIYELAPGASYSIPFNLALLFDLTVRGKYAVTVAADINPYVEGKFNLRASDLEFAISSPPPIIPVEKKPGEKESKQKEGKKEHP